jgi:hypothetical protein
LLGDLEGNCISTKFRDKHSLKIGYIIAIILPVSLFSSYLYEFELNKPIEWPQTGQVYVGGSFLNYTLTNNVRDMGVANGDELIFFQNIQEILRE